MGLHGEGQRLQSSMLMSAASQAQADPFKKVKDLIQNLIERLLTEAKNEATKQGFCNTELGKAEKERDHRKADIKKLDVQISGLRASMYRLEEEIETLTADLEKLRDDLK